MLYPTQNTSIQTEHAINKQTQKENY